MWIFQCNHVHARSLGAVPRPSSNKQTNKQKIITEPPSSMTNNFLTQIKQRKMAFNVWGYSAYSIHFCILLVSAKGFRVGREEKKGQESAVNEEKYKSGLIQCLSTPALDGGGIWTQTPYGDLKHVTRKGHSSLLLRRTPVPRRWKNWLRVIVTEVKQWLCCWPRNGLWQPHYFSPATVLSENRFKSNSIDRRRRSERRSNGREAQTSTWPSKSISRQPEINTAPLASSCCSEHKSCIRGYPYLEQPQHFWKDFPWGEHAVFKLIGCVEWVSVTMRL